MHHVIPGAVMFSVIAARVTHLQLKIFVASVEARSPFVDLVGPAVESVSLATSVHETVKRKYAARCKFVPTSFTVCETFGAVGLH